jgi:hypothetical protein
MFTFNTNSKSAIIRRNVLVQQSARLGLSADHLALLAAASEQSRQDRRASEQAYEDAYVKAYCG